MGRGQLTVAPEMPSSVVSYWGEPFPVYYKDGMPYMLSEEQLPLELPEVDAYLPMSRRAS